MRFSSRSSRITSSAIREILKVTERPEVISFAGGLPSPQVFPVQAVRDACARVLATDPVGALQYGTTEGYLPLRRWIARSKGVDADRVLLTTGSQQALDLVGKVLIEPGEPVLVETPTYLGALQAFSMFEPRFVSMPSDDEGVQPAALDEPGADQARFAYLLPNFQNPTGRSLSLPRRRAFVERARSLGLPIVEDDPYGELDYQGQSLPSLMSMHPDGVIYLGSLSKILAPGLRLGYAIAPPQVHHKLVQAKQAADLHTSTFAQQVAFEVLQTGLLETHVPQIRRLYASQCDAMLAALAAHMPAGVSWNRPHGGMFVWVRLPQGMDSAELLERAVAERVAFVPGAPFYAGTPQHNTLRLAFVTVPVEQINEGVARLARVIERIANHR